MSKLKKAAEKTALAGASANSISMTPMLQGSNQDSKMTNFLFELGCPGWTVQLEAFV